MLKAVELEHQEGNSLNSFKLGGISVFLLAGIAATYFAQYSWLALMLGLIVGCTGHLMWTWGWLECLNEPSPWRALRWELANFRNVVLSNRRESWNSLYEQGEYGLMVATAPEPRHYLVAGIVHSRFPSGFRVLDVGFGPGVLYQLIAGPGVSYVGIDVVDQMTRDCRARFSGDTRCEFVTCGFEEYTSTHKFDVVVMTELLYYNPEVESAEALFRKAQGLLHDANSVVIVSMGGKANLGIRKIWRRLDALSTPLQAISLIDPQSGNIKTLKVYPPTSGAKRSTATSQSRQAG